jgi:hypothetical protein
MTCAGCRGVMLKERLYDLLENDGQAYVSGWGWVSRCLACGKVSDWTIEQNRQIAANAVTGDQGKMTVKNAEVGWHEQ